MEEVHLASGSLEMPIPSEGTGSCQTAKKTNSKRRSSGSRSSGSEEEEEKESRLVFVGE